MRILIHSFVVAAVVCSTQCAFSPSVFPSELQETVKLAESDQWELRVQEHFRERIGAFSRLFFSNLCPPTSSEVKFSVGEAGNIFGIRVTKPSGNNNFDAFVLSYLASVSGADVLKFSNKEKKVRQVTLILETHCKYDQVGDYGMPETHRNVFGDR